MANAPGTSGDWAYTHLLEYICHSTSGGTITLGGVMELTIHYHKPLRKAYPKY